MLQVYFFGILPAFSVLTFIFAKKRWVRLTLLLSLAFLCIGYLSDFWVYRHYEAVSCKGNIMKGLRCPEWSVITRLAVAHQLSFLIGVAYLIFVFPILGVLMHISEGRGRRT